MATTSTGGGDVWGPGNLHYDFGGSTGGFSSAEGGAGQIVDPYGNVVGTSSTVTDPTYGTGGTTTTTNTTETTGGTTNLDVGDFFQEDTGVTEDTRSEAERIIDETYQAGLSSLANLESGLQPAFDARQAALLDEQGVQRDKARSEETQDLAELAENEASEKRRLDSAIALARREANEWMQGVASRFGGRGGLGQFASELVGRQALENIAGNRQEFQNVRGKIIQAGEKIKMTTQNFIRDLELQTRQLVDKARSDMATAMREIAERRDLLGQAKAQQQLQNLYQYQDTINAINQRNIDLKNRILFKSQQYSQRLAQIAAADVPEYSFNYRPDVGLEMGGDVTAKTAPDVYGVYEQVKEGGFPDPVNDDNSLENYFLNQGVQARV